MSEILKPPKEIQNQIIVLQKTIDDIKGKIEELNERIKKDEEFIEILEDANQKLETRNHKLTNIKKTVKYLKILGAVVNAIISPIALYNTLNITDSKLKNSYLENIKHSQTALDILTKQFKERELELNALKN